MLADPPDPPEYSHEFLDQSLVAAQAFFGVQGELLDWNSLVLEVVDPGERYQYGPSL